MPYHHMVFYILSLSSMQLFFSILFFFNKFQISSYEARKQSFLLTYSVLNCFLSSPSFAKPLFHTIMHIFGRSVVADWAYTLYRTTRLTSSVPSLFRINASIVSDSFALCNNRVNAVFVNQKTRKNSLFYFFSVTFHRSGAICFHKTTLQFFLITQVKLNHFQA